jgi:ABC-2 type transport system permease protein
MRLVRQYLDLVSMEMRYARGDILIISLIQLALALGLVLGFGYLIPDISTTSATFLTTGAATQSFVTIGLVMLPQMLSQRKAEGRLEYMLTLPISREAYLLALVTFVGLLALPGVVFTLLFGAWHYGLDLSVNPMFIVVMLLSVFSMAGLGVAMAVYSPHQQVTNALTQLLIFYVLFFSPVLVPKTQLPSLLAHIAKAMPTTYSADAVRATLTDLPGTHLGQSLAFMGVYSVISLALCSFAIRRRG